MGYIIPINSMSDEPSWHRIPLDGLPLYAYFLAQCLLLGTGFHLMVFLCMPTSSLPGPVLDALPTAFLLDTYSCGGKMQS